MTTITKSEPYHTWGYLAGTTPFDSVFPDRRVPLISIFPITPREAGAPRCYLVDTKLLSDEQIAQLADMLWTLWRPECESAEAAAAYIRMEGLPLRTTWFGSVGTTRIGMLL